MAQIWLNRLAGKHNHLKAAEALVRHCVRFGQKNVVKRAVSLKDAINLLHGANTGFSGSVLKGLSGPARGT